MGNTGGRGTAGGLVKMGHCGECVGACAQGCQDVGHAFRKSIKGVKVCVCGVAGWPAMLLCLALNPKP